MKPLFYAALGALVLVELAQVYLVMPMPGSQGLDLLQLAWGLHAGRWPLRLALGAAIATGAPTAFRARRRWLPATAVLLTAAAVWTCSGMTAESLFQPPRELLLRGRAENVVPEDAVVLGLEVDGDARAYPLRFLVHHHQVRDTVGGRPVLVTYCSVCRTGRVFAPVVDGRPETFRLVGMDHFNAMFEDATTGTWWRQATGEAVAGPLEGSVLPTVASTQVSLRSWLALHPDALVMQPDPASTDRYDPDARFERGESTGELTRTDRASWQDKSWVVGVEVGATSKAYDWNRLVDVRLVQDVVGTTPIVLALATDGQGFAAFERPSAAEAFTLAGDVLSVGDRSYDLAGRDLADPARRLTPVPAHQEFWHSWRTFHPDTLRDLQAGVTSR